MDKTVIIGAGVMGTALAIHLANNGKEVALWGTKWDKDALDQIKKEGFHPALEGIEVPKSLEIFYEDQLEEALADRKLIILAVLSQGIEDMSKEIAPLLVEGQIIGNISKGIHGESLQTMTGLIESSLGDKASLVSFVKVGGPIIARELASGGYTQAIFASRNLEAARTVYEIFTNDRFRATVSEDIDGVELCASFKNCYAITMGIMDGLEAQSNNGQAALMTQGVLEMSRIAKAYGGELETAYGVAGLGDYYVTSQGGRNGIFGGHLGRGSSIEEARELMNYQAVEGIPATENGYKLLEKLEDQNKINIKEDLPLFIQLYEILVNGKAPDKAMGDFWAGK